MIPLKNLPRDLFIPMLTFVNFLSSSTHTHRLLHRERFWHFVEEFGDNFRGKYNVAYDDSHMFYAIKPLNIPPEQGPLQLSRLERTSQVVHLTSFFFSILGIIVPFWMFLFKGKTEKICSNSENL